MALTFSDGTNLNTLTPTPEAYISYDSYGTLVDFSTSQNLPDTYSDLVEKFGNQSIQGFLAKTSAEFPLKADKITWSEEGRLHLYYEAATYATSNDRITLSGSNTHAIRVGQVIKIQNTTADPDTFTLARVNAVVAVSNVDNRAIDVDFYQADSAKPSDGDTVNIRVVGSEFQKGTNGMAGSVESQFDTYSNEPTIMKDRYEIDGSDTAQIGWIKVDGGAESSPFGQGGWLWYIKSEMDNRKRFMDLLETQALEIRKAVDGSDMDSNQSNLGKTQGVFESLEDRAINSSGTFFDVASDDFADFATATDDLLKELDKQGAIQENLMFLNRDENLAIDNGLATANSYGTGGQSYGAFNNSSDMALNLGFTSWHRGSYTFHKTDWKYLNQVDSITDVKGILAPSGSMNVYDQGIGGTAKRPFIHVRYRASQTDNRKLKHWITGSVGARTSEKDVMEMHYLSERCTIVQGANNFVLFK